MGGSSASASAAAIAAAAAAAEAFKAGVAGGGAGGAAAGGECLWEPMVRHYFHMNLKVHLFCVAWVVVHVSRVGVLVLGGVAGRVDSLKEGILCRATCLVVFLGLGLRRL